MIRPTGIHAYTSATPPTSTVASSPMTAPGTPADSLGSSVPAPTIEGARAASILFQKRGASQIENRWSVSGSNWGSPVIDSKGSIYASLRYPESVVSLAPSNGDPRWTAKISPTSHLLLAPDEKLLLVTAKDGRLHALDPASGTEAWSVEANGWPQVGADGHVYVPGQGNLSRIDLRNHCVAETTPLEHEFESAPAVGPDGTIYGGGKDGNLYALEPGTARVKWTCQTGGMLRNSPVVGPDGTVYAGCIGKAIVAVDPRDGSEKWRTSTPQWIIPEPAIGPDGTVYVGCSDNKVYALDPSNGTPLWSFEADGEIRVTPVPARDGVVYVVSDRNRIYGVDQRNGNKLWSTPAASYVHCPPAVDHHGGLVVGVNDSKIYAFRDNETARRVDAEEAQRDAIEAGTAAEPPPAVEQQDGWIVIGGVRVPVNGAPH